MPSDRPYAGLGCRRTPPDVIVLMEWVAGRLMLENWIGRTGGGTAPEKVFHRGASLRSAIYLPEAAAG